MRDVEALGLDWLEGPENRAGGKPRAGGPPPPAQDRGLVLLPFRRPRLPFCTLGDWEELGGDAGGQARALAELLPHVRPRPSSVYIHISAASRPLCF